MLSIVGDSSLFVIAASIFLHFPFQLTALIVPIVGKTSGIAAF